MKLEIRKEFFDTCDAGSNNFTVKVLGDKLTPFVEIEGSARNIFAGNTYHLDEEFSEKLMHFNIEPDDIRDALEAGENFAECEDVVAPKKFEIENAGMVNAIRHIIVGTLNIKSVEDGRSVCEKGAIVGIENDDTIIFERDLKKLCINADLREEWELLKKHMKLED